MRLMALLVGTFTQATAMYTAYVFLCAFLFDHIALKGSPNQGPEAERATIVMLCSFGVAIIIGGIVAFRVGRGLCTLAGALVLSVSGLALWLFDLTADGYVFPSLTGVAIGLIGAGGLLERAGWLGIAVALVANWASNRFEDSIDVESMDWVEAVAPHLPWVLPAVLFLSVLSVLFSFAVRPLNDRWVTAPIDFL